MLLCGIAPAACSKSGTSPGESSDLRIALPIDLTTLNPILSQNTIESFVDGLVFDELVTLDDRGHDVPDLAAVVPTTANGGISKDGLTITYHLRHGVTWHDGAPFSSADVAYSWRAIMNPANNVLSRRGYDEIASIDTPDPYTAVLHMKRLFAPAIDTIFAESDTPYRILPAHLLAKYANLNSIPFNAAPIGTGPFRFVRWERGDRIVLSANPSYFRGAPKLATLTLFIIPDGSTTEAQVRSHEVDLALQLTGLSYRNLAGVPGVTRRLVVAPVFNAVEFNTSRAPLDDISVRRALLYAINRPGIVRDDTYGDGILATADLSPFYWAYDRSLHPAPYDPARAKSLLDAAGWRVGPGGVRTKNGERLELVLVYGQGSQLSRNVTLEVQQQLSSVGIDATLRSYPYAMLYAAAQSGGIINGGKFDLAFYSWVSGSDPDNSSQWLCSAIPPAGNNISRYCSAEMDAQQQIALSTFDRRTRAAAYSRIEALLLRDAPAAFLYYRPLAYAYSSKLTGFAPNGISEGWNAQDWAL